MRTRFRGLVLGFALCAAALGPGCNSSSGAGLSASCSINSDCNSPLSCAFARCHNACVKSVDCPAGERCVTSGKNGVCQLPQESACGTATTACQSGQVCGTDNQCREQCSTSVACNPGDSCLSIGGASACYSPSSPADQGALMIADGGMPADSGADGALQDGDSATLLDVVAESSCDVVATVPDFVSGYWLVFNSMNTMGPPDISCAGGSKCIWDGSTMTFASQVPTCGGATLAGTAHWVTTDGVGNGTTQLTGSYDSATRLVTLFETSPSATHGEISSSKDSITYDPTTDEFVNGSAICWLPNASPNANWPAGCANVSPAVWNARHVVGDASSGLDSGSGD